VCKRLKERLKLEESGSVGVLNFKGGGGTYIQLYPLGRANGVKRFFFCTVD